MSDHPEIQPGECFVGNIWGSDFQNIGWQTKRLGITPLGIDGSNLRGGNLRPCFAQRAELEKAGITVNDTGINDHNWKLPGGTDS
jgi:hypothetical protein